MIRHIVLWNWSDGTTEEQKKQAADGLAKLLSLVPTVRTFAFGADAGIDVPRIAGNFDFAVTVDCDDVTDFVAFHTNPDHRTIAGEHLIPFVGKSASIQFEF
jgi:hypothetical protein